MAGEFKIKTGLLLGPAPTQSVSSIQDTSISITSDASSLIATGKAIYDFVSAETAGFSTDISNLETSVGTLDVNIQTNATDITNLETSMGVVNGLVMTNITDIAINEGSIGFLEDYQLIQDGSISRNTQKWIDSNRNGFLNQDETTLSFNDTTGVFTLGDAGSGWSYYLAGKKYTFSGNSTATLPGGGGAADDRYFIYINNTTDGSLVVSTSVWDRESGQLPVAFIDWESGNTSSKYWVGEERHTMLIDTRMHRYLHNTRGTQFVSGGTLDGPDVAGTGGIGATDASNALGVVATVIADEDIYQTLSALSRPATPLSPGNNYNVFYRTGASSWSWKFEDTPLPESGSYIEYDNGTGLSATTAGKYVNTYLLFTNLNDKARFSILPGQGEFDTLDEALNENPNGFDLTGLPIVEYVMAWQFTWEASAGLTTKGKVSLASDPVRIEVNAATASTPTTEAHNDLLGLQGGTTNEYYHLTSAQYSDYIGKTDVDASLSDVWDKLGEVDTSLGAHDTWIASIATDVTNLETSMGVVNGLVMTNITDIANLETSVGVLDGLIQTNITDIANLETSVGNINQYWELDGSILSPIDDTVNVQLSAIQIGTDAGTVSVIDMDVSSAGAGSEQSYSFNIDGTQIAKVYSEGNGSGGIQEESFKVLETLYAESSVYLTSIPDVSTSYVLYYNPTTDQVSYSLGDTTGGVTALSGLTDVSIGGTIPDGSVLVYNSTQSVWTYGVIDANITWGEIGGTLSNQTDLYNPWLVEISTNKLENTTDTFTGVLTVNGSINVADITATGDVGIAGDVVIGGNLAVDGSLLVTHTETIDVSAAFIHLNTGLVGAPPEYMQSGIIVERGSQDPYAIIFDEELEQFRIGIAPLDVSRYVDSSTQAVATRQDAPQSSGVAYWNDSLNRMDTSVHLRYSGGNLLINNDVSVGSQIFAPNLTAGSQPALVFWNDSTGEFTQADASTLGYDASTFISLYDTPNSYNPVDASPGMSVVINDAGDGLEFGPRIWREESDEVTLVNEDANVLFYEHIAMEPDAGIATFVDKEVTASSALGTEETYRFNMDNVTIAEIYAESDGAGGIQEEKFVSSATFQAESSVYFTAIPEVSTGYVIYYDPVTDQLSYAEASLGGGGGGAPVNQVTDGLVYWNGSNYDTSTALKYNISNKSIDFRNTSIRDYTQTGEDRLALSFNSQNILYSTKSDTAANTYIYDPSGNANIRIAESGAFPLIIFDASAIGTSGHTDFDTYFTINNAQPRDITLVVKTEGSGGTDHFIIKKDGDIYCPSINQSSQTKAVYFNESTGEITYADVSTGGAATSLSQLGDVSIGGLGAAQDGSALVYNNTQSVWEYGVAGGAGGDYWTLDGSTLVPTDPTIDVKLSSIEVNEDAGAVSLVDMPVTSSPTAGTEESYAFDVDGSTVAKVWSEADGNGQLQETGFVVETYQYMGDPNTNGSWRFYPDASGNLTFEKRVSGSWVFSGQFT